jgi:hypothetical protein
MFYSVPTNRNCLYVYSESVPRSRATLRICNNLMHMWHHVTTHLIISNDKDSNSENRIKLRVRDNGFDSILTITDHDCSKAAIFIPCNETISAEGVARLYLHYVFPQYRLPLKVISDRDP